MRLQLLGAVGGVVGALLAYVALDAARTMASADNMDTTDHLTQVIPFNGRLEQDGSAYSGDIKMRFKLYDETGSSLGWSETWDGAGGRSSVKVRKGRFSVLLGKYTGGIADVTKDAEEVYVGVEVQKSSGGYEALFGQRRLETAAYAIIASQSANLDVAGSLTVGSATSVGSVTLSGGTATDDDDLEVGADLKLTTATALYLGVDANGNRADGAHGFTFGDGAGGPGAQLMYRADSDSWVAETGSDAQDNTDAMSISSATGAVALAGGLDVAGNLTVKGDFTVPNGNDLVLKGQDAVVLGKGEGGSYDIVWKDPDGKEMTMRYNGSLGKVSVCTTNCVHPIFGVNSGLGSNPKGVDIGFGDLYLNGTLRLKTVALGDLSDYEAEGNDADKTYIASAGCQEGRLTAVVDNGQPAICVCLLSTGDGSAGGRGYYCWE